LADPFGRVIAKASHDAEEILLGEIDLGLIEETRHHWPFLRDRRIDAYGPITKRYLDFGESNLDVVEPSQQGTYRQEFEKGLISGPRYRFDEIPDEQRSGIYAFFLKDHSALSALKISASNLIYIGMTKSSIGKRNPLFHEYSSSHSLRRSLGALLKDELDLHAIPRAGGDITNYRFRDSGEDRLTTWMRRNLEYSFVLIGSEINRIEAELIRHLGPPLNLTNPENLCGSLVKRARRRCQTEAAASDENAG
jgi:hypothetical protein